MKFSTLLVLAVLISSTSVIGSNDLISNEDICDILVKVPVSSSGDVRELINLGLQIEHNVVRNGVAEGFISRKNLKKIEDSGFNVYDGLQEESNKKITRLKNASRKSWYTYSDVHDLLDEWSTEYSEIAQFDTAGFSIQDRAVYQMKISGSPDTAVRQRIYLNGSCHGNEWIGTESCMRVMSYFLENYATDQTVKEIVDRTDFVFHPIQNPDGFTSGSNGRRTLANGVDPNRAFGYKFNGGDTDNTLPYEWPEVKVYLHCMIEAPWYLNIDYHCGTITVYHAGGFGADREAYNTIRELYPLKINTGDIFYQPENRSGGYGYTAAYGKCGSIALLPELCQHYPPESDIEELTQFNLDCLLDILDEMQKGVRGRVTNAETGAPVYARVKITNQGSSVFTDPRTGAFHKYFPNPSGTIEVTVFANGFTDETKTIQANPGAFADLDFQLTPDDEQRYAALSVDVIGVGNSSSTENTRKSLGLHDNEGVTIEDGFMIVDFGPFYFLTNKDGDDLTVYSTNSDAYTVSAHWEVNKVIDEEGIAIGEGSGEQSFDLEEVNLDSARWVRIDVTSGSPSIDAIECNPRDIPTHTINAAVLNRPKSKARVLFSPKGMIIQSYLDKGPFTITMYSINGKKIVLKRGNTTTAGIQRVNLDAFDYRASLISGGIYVFHIQYSRGKEVIKAPVMWHGF